MEFSNLEEENDYKSEMISDFVEQVAPFVMYKEITDDNCSYRNGLSGLDQVILFEIEEYLDDIFDLEFVKAAIKIQIAFLKKEVQEGKMREEHLLDETFKELTEDENFYEEGLEKEYGDDFFLYEEDLYYDDEEEKGEYTVYEFNDPEFQKKLKSVAIGNLRGVYTTDNPSRINGMTGIEQVINYVSLFLEAEDEYQEIRNYEKVEKQIVAYILDFKGGCNLTSSTIY